MKLLLKRTIAKIIDLIMFLLIGWLFFALLEYNSLRIELTIVILINYISAIIFPILILKNTIGNSLLGIKYVNNNIRNKLIIKHTIYFFIFFNISDRIYFLFKNLFDIYTIIDLPLTLSLRLSASVLLVSILFYILTLGKASFFDLMLSINIEHKILKGKKHFLLISSLSIMFFFIFLGMLEYRFKSAYNISGFVSKLESSLYTGYYPSEVFGGYLDKDAPLIFQFDQKGSNAITLSNVNSVIMNTYINTRNISVIINEKTKNSTKLRRDLAYKILEYEPYTTYLNNVSVDQIIFHFYHYEYYYLFNYRYKFTYYFDTKGKSYFIHGGVKEEELLNYYYQVDSSYYETTLQSLADAFNIHIDTLKKYIDEEGNIALPEYINENIESDTLTRKYIYEPPVLNLTLLRFEEVEPEIIFGVTYPLNNYKMIPFKEIYITENRLYEARNKTIINRIIGID